MSIIQDPYYSRPEVSNSDLTALKNYNDPKYIKLDLELAFKFGSLLDAMITENSHVDYYNYLVGQVQYDKEDFDKALEMKKVFFKDNFCKRLAEISDMQKVTIKHGFEIEYGALSFNLDARCKWDFFANNIDLSGDLKTTACSNEKKFKATIDHYNYDRQAAWYMDLEGKNNFMFIGISKVNHNIFKVPVKRGDAIYNAGKKKYQELAFNYWYLFGDLKTA